MWGRLVEQARRAGPKKILILAVLIVIAVILAYGNHTTDNAASGSTLPSAAKIHAVSSHAATRRP